MKILFPKRGSLIGPLVVALALGVSVLVGGEWEKELVAGKAHKRHEHAFVKVGGRFYALGGRRIQPVDVFDPTNLTWSQASAPPLELHHFQALEREGVVVVAGAFTGKFPAETPVPHLYFYHPREDQWRQGPEIPPDRQRGSVGAFLRGDKLYLVSGLTDGHRSGWVPWFDEYDFASGAWRKLPDAPRSRDHFQAVLIGDELYLAGGRRSGQDGSVFQHVIKEVDVFDFRTGRWRTLPSPEGDIPTPRAGTSALAVAGQVVVIGGESERREAHREVEVFDPMEKAWRAWPLLPEGRHATQPILHQGKIYLQAGSVTRGGTETDSLIRFTCEE